MSSLIEDYALIGDCQTAALVGRDGSIDWLCFPRFDSGACFAALLGTPEHGRWLVAPADGSRSVSRRYRDGTLVLETEFETADGAVTVIDCMPVRTRHPDVVRQVVGRRGTVQMHTELTIRFDYGSVVPWVRSTPHGITAVAGPDVLRLFSDVPLHGENLHTVGDFTVAAGQTVSFVLTWLPSHLHVLHRIDAGQAVQATEAWWREWSDRCTYEGEWRDAVVRSLITLKAMTYAPTGGIIAAVTTSLPEQLGGCRNWDYRFCWLRDASYTLYALLQNGYYEEAQDWREWLLRSVAGSPTQLQIMYGLAGERRLTELTLDWLPGYKNSPPVRIGNGAHNQFQLDVFGEVMDAFHLARESALQPSRDGWRITRAIMEHLENVWNQPDEGIWEVRGPRRHFTHSKVMAWVALDRVIKDVEHLKLSGPVNRWRKLRDTIHAEVCAQGYDPALGSFVQSYGSKELDAALLMLAPVGFLPASDPRIQGTVRAIEQHLMHNGLVDRYLTESNVDGLPPGEGAFLLCSFWLADNYALLHRWDDARALFERLLAMRNDVGLLAEEYDPVAGHQLGNFPQAFSHVGLINTARNLASREGPAKQRQAGWNDMPAAPQT